PAGDSPTRGPPPRIGRRRRARSGDLRVPQVPVRRAGPALRAPPADLGAPLAPGALWNRSLPSARVLPRLRGLPCHPSARTGARAQECRWARQIAPSEPLPVRAVLPQWPQRRSFFPSFPWGTFPQPSSSLPSLVRRLSSCPLAYVLPATCFRRPLILAPADVR